ncbi:MAG: hypothetical protein ABSG94_12810 [Brevinematales bacterium]
MTQKRYLSVALVICLLMISIGSFITHARGHLISENPAYLVPFLAGLISILVLPLMFLNKRLVAYAYLINGMLTLIGTITLIHFAFVSMPRRVNLNYLIMKSVLPDILILWSVFAIGKLIYDLEMTSANTLDGPRPKGRFIRYPNMGYWLIHLFALSIIYFLGHVLWR